MVARRIGPAHPGPRTPGPPDLRPDLHRTSLTLKARSLSLFALPSPRAAPPTMDDPQPPPAASTPVAPATAPAPVTTVPTLLPKLLVPLHTARAGNFSSAVVQFAQPPGASPTETTLVITQQLYLPTTLQTIRWHTPTLASLVLLAVAIFAYRTLRRTARAPRILGRLYCRACNYDLSPLKPGDPVTANCPECGLSTARKRPVMAEPLLFRLLMPFVACLGTIIVCLALLGWSLHWVPGGSSQLIWPIPGIVSLVPRYGLSHQIEHNGTVITRLTLTSLVAGTTLKPHDIANPWGYVSVAPSGNLAASIAIENNNDPLLPGSQAHLIFVDLRSGESRSCPPAPLNATVNHAPTFSRDGSKVWYMLQIPRGNPSVPNFDYEIVETDVGTLRQRVIHRISGATILAPNGSPAYVYSKFLSHEDGRGSTFYVVAMTQYNTSGTNTVEGRIYKSGTGADSVITLPATAANSYFPATLSRDATTISVGLHPATNGTLVADLTTGIVTTALPPAATPAPITAPLAALAPAAISPTAPLPGVTRDWSLNRTTAGTFNLFDPAGAQVATLAVPASSGFGPAMTAPGWTGSIAMSLDNRYAASQLLLPSNSVYGAVMYGPTAYFPHVVVWDLAPLNLKQSIPPPAADLSNPQSTPR